MTDYLEIAKQALQQHRTRIEQPWKEQERVQDQRILRLEADLARLDALVGSMLAERW